MLLEMRIGSRLPTSLRDFQSELPPRITIRNPLFMVRPE